MSTKKTSSKIKIGDIFEIYLTEDKKQFFQYVADDNYLGPCNVIQVIDCVFPATKDFDLSYLRGYKSFYRLTHIKPWVKNGLFKQIANEKIAGEKNILFKQFENFPQIFPAPIYRIRKVGQDIHTANVEKETYKRHEKNASEDGVYPGPALKLELLKKYDVLALKSYERELEAGNVTSIVSKKENRELNKEEAIIRIYFNTPNQNKGMEQIDMVESLLGENYLDGHGIDLERLEAEVFYFVPNKEAKAFFAKCREVLEKKLTFDAFIQMDQEEPITIKANSNWLDKLLGR